MRVVVILFALCHVTQAYYRMETFSPEFDVYLSSNYNNTKDIMGMLKSQIHELEDIHNTTEADGIIQKIIDGFKNLQTLRGALIFQDISLECHRQMEAFDENLRNPGNNSWALKMVDASSKVQSGILSLNVGELGNFDQCIRTKTVDERVGVIKGKYCLGSLQVNSITLQEFKMFFSKSMQDILNEQIDVHNTRSLATQLGTLENTYVQAPSWAGCFPDGCTTEDINSMTETVIQYFAKTSNFKVIFEDNKCQTEEDVFPTLTAGAWITLFILGSYFAFLIFCSIYDFHCQNQGEDTSRIIAAFSFYTNGKKLFKYPNNNDEEMMPCLDGMRSLSLMWVILLHQYSITCAGPIMNGSDLLTWANSWHSMFIVSGSLSIDTFFVIGATLAMFSYLKMRKSDFRRTPKNFFLFYLHRYLRLTPALAAVVLVSSTLLVYMGSGPNWPSVNRYFQENCVQYWWSPLIYLQNYINVEKMCAGHSWYLSVDMQLFFFSQFIFASIHRYPKRTLLLLMLCALTSMTFAYSSARVYRLTALLSNPFGNSAEYTNKYYLLTHTRAAPWFIGLFFGYILYDLKRNKKFAEMRELPYINAWMFSIGLFLGCIMVGHQTLRQAEYDESGNALHIAFVRPVWAFAICIIIFACVIGKAEIINWFLTLPVFRVLNRLNYCMYLVHVTMMYLMAFAKKTPVYFSDFEMVFQFWGTYIFCMAISIPWTLAFESPVIALEKIFLLPLKDREELAVRIPSTPTSPSRKEEYEGGLEEVISDHERSTDSSRENISTPVTAKTPKTSTAEPSTSSVLFPSGTDVEADRRLLLQRRSQRALLPPDVLHQLNTGKLTPSREAAILSTIEEESSKSNNGNGETGSEETGSTPQKNNPSLKSPVTKSSPKPETTPVKSNTPSKRTLAFSAVYGASVVSKEIEKGQLQPKKKLETNPNLIEERKVQEKVSRIESQLAEESSIKGASENRDETDTTNFAGVTSAATEPTPWTKLLELTSLRDTGPLDQEVSSTVASVNKESSASAIEKTVLEAQAASSSAPNDEKEVSEQTGCSHLKTKLEANPDEEPVQKKMAIPAGEKDEATGLPTKIQSPQGAGCRCGKKT